MTGNEIRIGKKLLKQGFDFAPRGELDVEGGFDAEVDLEIIGVGIESRFGDLAFEFNLDDVIGGVVAFDFRFGRIVFRDLQFESAVVASFGFGDFIVADKSGDDLVLFGGATLKGDGAGDHKDAGKEIGLSRLDSKEGCDKQQ